MNLSIIQQLLAEPLAKTEALLMEQFDTQAELVNELTSHTINSGGKRLRPILTLLSGLACGSDEDQIVTMAVIIEYIHTATLLHDDVVDHSTQRRGQPTASAIWNNAASVLVGDFLYSRAFQLMVSLENPRVLSILSDTTNTIAQGEVLQLMNRHNDNLTLEQYLSVIEAKTAKLFEAAAQIGAVLANQSEPVIQAMASFGRHLGMGFQMIDDILDYTAPTQALGKNLGDDLSEGKVTLPLIQLLEKGSPAQVKLARQAIQQGNSDALDELSHAIKASGALEHAQSMATKEIELAIAALPELTPSDYESALQAICQLTANRQY